MAEGSGRFEQEEALAIVTSRGEGEGKLLGRWEGDGDAAGR